MGAQRLLNGLLRSLQHVPTANYGSCFEGRGWSGMGIPLFCSTSPSDKLPPVISSQLGHGFFQNIFIVLFHTGGDVPPPCLHSAGLGFLCSKL